MKKPYIVILGGIGLVFVFVLARHLYQSQRTEELEVMAQSSDSPLVRDYAQSIGPADAKVVIVEFFDPGCETCRLFATAVKGLLKVHDGKIRLVLRYAPFHHGADTMVKILEAGRFQGRYWETLQVMFDTQHVWASHHAPQPDKIWQFLPAAGLDVDQLRVDMNSPRIQQIIEQDIEDAKTLGVRKTPEFFVNGKPLPRFGFDQLQSLVETEVAANYAD